MTDTPYPPLCASCGALHFEHDACRPKAKATRKRKQKRCGAFHCGAVCQRRAGHAGMHAASGVSLAWSAR